jgi:predicted homoserine dehydrogenase-like protein
MKLRIMAINLSICADMLSPKLETVRIGVVGLGMRGSDAVSRLSYIEGAEITAICVISILTGLLLLKKHYRKWEGPAAKNTAVKKDIKLYVKAIMLILFYTPTPWHLHTPVAGICNEKW